MTHSDNPVQISRIGQTTHYILHVVRFGIMFMGKGCLYSLIYSRHFVLEQSYNYLHYYGVHLEFRLPLWRGNVGSGACTELPDSENEYYELKSRC